MKVSIITAVYNGAASIAHTISSVAAQDFADVEHIVIDGGSSDATLAIVRQTPGRVSTVFSEKDNGVYEAFNKGIARATGEAVIFLNSGDSYLDDGAISKLTRVLENGPDAAFGDVLIVDARTQTRVVRRYSSRHFRPERMKFGLMPAHPTLMLRRSVFRDVGLYDPTYRIAGDFEHCLRAFCTHRTTYQYLPDTLVRMPSGGLSNQGWRSKSMISREMKSACDRNGVATNLLKLSLRFPLKALELV